MDSTVQYGYCIASKLKNNIVCWQGTNKLIQQRKYHEHRNQGTLYGGMGKIFPRP